MAEKKLFKEDLFRKKGDSWSLVAGKCTSCGQAFFPMIDDCLSCEDGKVEEITVESNGTLFTFTTTEMASSGFKPPYSVGYVDFPEGVRLFTQLDKDETKPFQIGMEMEIYIGELWERDGVTTLGYRCRPV